MQIITCSEEIAYNTIKRRILEGELEPGTRLVHRGLAKELDMSPSPVVLALRMLERDGLVVNTPGLGACVRKWSRSDISDLYHLRAQHEGLASRLCAERASGADLDSLRQAHANFQRTIDSGQEEANIQADVEIHWAIVKGAHSADLERLVDSMAIMQCSMKAFGLSLGIPRFMYKGVRDVHLPLIEAILSRDSVLAERYAREHVERSLSNNLAWLENAPDTSEA